jgi:hypothetical protein
MNLVLRIAVASAVAGAGLVASAAYANNLTPTNTCNPGPSPTCTTQRGSDLVLEVFDSANGQYYNFDTGASLDSVITVAQIQTAQGPATNPAIVQGIGTGTLAFNGSTINAGPNLGAFLAESAASAYTWTIVAGDTQQTGTATVGNNRFMFASTANPLNTPGSSTIKSSASNVNQQFSAINGSTQTLDVNTVAGFGTQSSDTGFYGSIGQGGAGLGKTGAQYLFVLAGSGTSDVTGNVFATTGQFWLDSAGVHYIPAGGPPVPLPAAIWLLGSGLLGLVGISRRRRDTTV